MPSVCAVYGRGSEEVWAYIDRFLNEDFGDTYNDYALRVGEGTITAIYDDILVTCELGGNITVELMD